VFPFFSFLNYRVRSVPIPFMTVAHGLLSPRVITPRYPPPAAFCRFCCFLSVFFTNVSFFFGEYFSAHYLRRSRSWTLACIPQYFFSAPRPNLLTMASLPSYFFFRVPPTKAPPPSLSSNHVTVSHYSHFPPYLFSRFPESGGLTRWVFFYFGHYHLTLFRLSGPPFRQFGVLLDCPHCLSPVFRSPFFSSPPVKNAQGLALPPPPRPLPALPSFPRSTIMVNTPRCVVLSTLPSPVSPLVYLNLLFFACHFFLRQLASLLRFYSDAH